MANKSYIEESKVNWRSSGLERSPTNEEIQTGCMQRIATATELMAGNFIKLQNDVEYWKTQYNRANDERLTLKATIKSLRGWVTRYKNRG